jgi:hypothetical protein
MRKEELLAGLQNVRNNYLFGMLLTYAVKGSAFESLRGKRVELVDRWGSATFDPSAIVTVISDPKQYGVILEEYRKSLRRAAMREGYELLYKYCIHTNQWEKARNNPLIQFARVIRNIVSHQEGGTQREWPNGLRDMGVTTVSWRGTTIAKRMKGQPIEFGQSQAALLLQDQIDFAEKDLL